jgi:hypothetical protein
MFLPAFFIYYRYNNFASSQGNVDTSDSPRDKSLQEMEKKIKISR